MSSEQEYEYYNEEAMYDIKLNDSDEYYDWREKYHQGANGVLAHIMMIIIYPAGMATSLMLLVAVIRHTKIRAEPWRWLIAHASLCIFMTVFFLFMHGLTDVYLLPSLVTSRVLCPTASYIDDQFYVMTNVSIALIIAERFAAMRKDKWKEGGMAKKDVIISLAFFWLVDIATGITNAALNGVRTHSMNRYGIEYICSGNWSKAYVIPHVTSFLWLMVTTIVGLIASIVYARKKPDQDKKRDLIIPTLVVCIFLIIFYELGRFIGAGMYFSFSSLTIALIVFSLTWLIVWTRNGDIQWRNLISCCPENKEEEIQLIEANGDDL